MATFVWTGGGGDDQYGNAANWNDETDRHNPALRAPIASDTVLFTTGSGTLFGTGNSGILQFQSGGPWTVGGTIAAGTFDIFIPLTVSGSVVSRGVLDTADTLTLVSGAHFTAARFDAAAGGTLAMESGSSGTVTGMSGVGLGIAGAATIDDAVLVGTGTQFQINSTGGASLSIENSAQVSAATGFIGAQPSQSGSVTISSAGTWTLSGSVTDGDTGVGSLLINGGSLLTGGAEDHVGVGSGGSGTAVVSGSGSLWRSTGNLAVGTSTSGTVAVQNSGLVSFGGGLFAGISAASMGTISVSGGGELSTNGSANEIGAGGTGSLSVDGAASEWLASGQIQLGVSGSGVLNVTNGGSVGTTKELFIGAGTSATGALVIANGGTVSSGGSSSVISEAAGSQGTVTVAGVASRWIVNSGLVVGNAGEGAVTIEAGGSIQVAPTVARQTAILLGGSAGAFGSLLVTDTGSTLRAIGAVEIGVNGNGRMTVQNGGTIITGGTTVTNSTGFFVADSAGSSGSVLVTGAGSALTNTGEMVIGGSGNPAQPGGLGSLQIAAGGTVTTALSTGTGPAADIAAVEGTDGSSVTVTGPASTWTIGGSLIVGDAAAGSLGVSAGGSVSATDLIIGNQSTATGNMSVGAGSTVTLSGTLTAGAAGTGDLDINGGGVVQAADAVVGSGGGSGVIDLEGTLSKLQVSSNLTITSGVVVVGAGSTLNVAGTLATSAFGRLQLLGGLVDPTVIENTSPTGPSGTVVATEQIINTSTYFAQGTGLSSMGTLLVSSPTISDGGSGTGGILQVQGFGNLFVNAATVDVSQAVDFHNGHSFGVLSIGSIAGFDAIISNFNTAAELLLQGVTITTDGTGGVTGVTYGTVEAIGSTQFIAGGEADGDNELILFSGTAHTGTQIGSLDISPAVAGVNLTALETVNSQGGLGALPCFAAGTRIRTARGEVAVEDLRVGDDVPVLVGGGVSRVVWIGRRVVACGRHKEPRTVWPVRVRSGAFGPGLPARDLYLSPDHALYLEEVLIPVRYLVDGEAIAQVPVGSVTYYHVELERHDVVLAEGLPAESFLDTGGRRMFDNGTGPLCLGADSRAPGASASSQARSAPVVLHPDFAIRLWEAEGCAPLVVTGVEVVAARRRVSEGRRAA